METRDIQDYSAPHQQPTSHARRYFEFLMQLTYKDPIYAQKIIRIIGAAGLALITSPTVASLLDAGMPRSLAFGAKALGATLTVGAGLSWFIQNKLYGLPIDKEKVIYENAEYSYPSTSAKLTCEPGSLPQLIIKADSHYDAGYAEGMILGKYLHECLLKSKNIYLPICAAMQAPLNTDKLHTFIAPVLEKIPAEYREEMQGKVDAYNRWCRENGIEEKPLTIEYYVTLQLLPDLHNYSPFKKRPHILSEIQPACTTFAMRSGDYLALGRVLDWPSYGFAGYYFLQIARHIKGKLATNDISIPLLSGALTIRNESGLLMEMNISHGDHVQTAQGMPATFFNRFCADNARTLTELADLIAENSPLSAYHLTATDGNEVMSYHFYQDHQDKNAHHVTTLVLDKQTPQLLITANEGVHHHGNTIKIHNHNDSQQRKANISTFFKHHKTQLKLTNSNEPIQELRETCLQIARLPIVNNPGSVLAAFFIYYRNELVDASIATDNAYAPNAELNEFKRLNYA